MTLIIVAFPLLRSSLLRFQYGACHFFDLLNPFFAAQWPPRFFRLSQALDFRFVFGTLTKEGGKVPIPFKNGCNLFPVYRPCPKDGRRHSTTASLMPVAQAWLARD